MAEYSVVAVYGTLSEAEAAAQTLGKSGFPMDKVSIIAKHLNDGKRVHGFIKAGDVAQWTATAGAWTGGIFGLFIGAAFLWVPSFGPLIVAGSLSAILLGGIEGAVAGAAVSGALGWLVGLGIAKEKIAKYETDVQGGKFLIIAIGEQDAIQKAEQTLVATRPEHLEIHVP